MNDNRIFSTGGPFTIKFVNNKGQYDVLHILQKLGVFRSTEYKAYVFVPAYEHLAKQLILRQQQQGVARD